MRSSRTAKIGDVLQLQRRWIEIDPVSEYVQIGVRSFGKGIFHYESKSGTELGRMRFLEVHPGDLVVSNIKAWEGAVGVATEKESGCIGTNRMLTYVAIDNSVVDVNYVRYFLLTHRGLELLAKASPGSADRNRTLGIDRFEALEIPLPDLDEQRRIAAKLDALLERSRQVQRLHETAVALSRASSNALVVENAPRVPIGDLVRQVKRVVPVEPTERYRLLGMRWYADGLFLKDVKPGIEISAKHLYQVVVGDFVYNRLFAWKGSFGIAREQHDGAFVSGEFPCFEVAADRILPEYLLAIFTKPKTWEAVLGNSRGSTPTSRNRLREEQFLEMSVPVPSLEVQQQIVRRIRRLQDAVRVQRRREPELLALEPSILNHAFNGQI